MVMKRYGHRSSTRLTESTHEVCVISLRITFSSLGRERMRSTVPIKADEGAGRRLFAELEPTRVAAGTIHQEKSWKDFFSFCPRFVTVHQFAELESKLTQRTR